jgi:hypothetical protein
MKAVIAWTTLIAIVFLHSVVFAQIKAKKSPKLVKASLTFETLDDDKDDNVKFTCIVSAGNGNTMAYLEMAEKEEFSDHSNKTFILSTSPELTKRDIEGFTAMISIETFGSDVWSFNAKIKMDFSDGTFLVKEKRNVRLSKDGDSITL